MTTHGKAAEIRTLQLALNHAGYGRALGFEIHAVDLGDGGSVHGWSGHVTAADGQRWRAAGTLSGVRFLPIVRKPGRPRKDARDMAVCLAYEWFLGREVAKDDSNQKRAAAIANERVLDLWRDRRWQGVSESSHVTGKVRTQRGVLKAMEASLLICTCHEEADGCMVAAKYDAFRVRTEEISVRGSAWFWNYGSELAECGEVNAVIPLTRSN